VFVLLSQTFIVIHFLSFCSFIHSFIIAMRLKGIFAVLGIAATTSAIGLHKALDGLLQVTPSFGGDDIALHPGLNPSHNSHDLEHLSAGLEKVLHYNQEGHRRKSSAFQEYELLMLIEAS
jgi:hypothetical protein